MPSPTRIVILGGGFAGAYCAKALNSRLRREIKAGQVEILLIDRHNYFVFFPLLVEAGTGTLQPSHAVVPIRSFLKRGQFLMANVTDINLQQKTISALTEYEINPRSIPFDHLVVALGSKTRWPEVPGLRDHALGIKTVAEAVSLRDRAICFLEQADATTDMQRRAALLHWVVIGGGYTGVEVAGEFNEYLRNAIAKYPGIQSSEIKITLVDRGSRILNTLHPSLSDYALKHLKKCGVDIRQGLSVTQVTEDTVTLSDGTCLSSCTCVMAAGIAPPQIITRAGLPTENGGWMSCQPDGRVTGHPNIWGCGDCAANPDPSGNAYPPTAQHAIREGRSVAANIALAIAGKPTKPIRIITQGWLAAFGRYEAVAMIFGLRISGILAWFLWRTIYLMKMPGLRRSCRVAMDWTADFLFDKDFVEIGVHRTLKSAKKKN